MKSLRLCHDWLSQASALAPGTTRYGYVYAVALQSDGQLEEALHVLKAIHERHPGNVEILYALTTFNRDAGRVAAARKYANRLVEIAPENANFVRLLSEVSRPRM